MSIQKNWMLSALVALFVSSAVVLASYYWLPAKVIRIESGTAVPVRGALYTLDTEGNYVPVDFTQTAEKVMEAVVHIKSGVLVSRQSSPSPFFFDDELLREFFGPRFRIEPWGSPEGESNQKPQFRYGSGSGVIISPDGYIVTNYHVIQNAEQLEVTLHDGRTFSARVIGTDPSTDLAVVKIDADRLQTIPFGNSDAVRVGEWVLAVGNPFNLNSTVTAGIVSAKARNIRILRDQYAVESFIQTDAAINPGNSGGALVDLNGNLIGINTAIASPTGAYAGYGFAVPSNIVNKVVEDILKYGSVQRGFLGVMIRDVDGNLASEKELKVTKGVYVEQVNEKSAAEAAGIKPGDVIVKVENTEVNNVSTLQEMIARHRPGDKVKIGIVRNNKEMELVVTLKNREGNTEITQSSASSGLSARLGAELANLSKEEKKRFKVDGGVKVVQTQAGKLANAGVKPGFIITHLDKEPILSVEDLAKKLDKKQGGVMIEGFYEDMPRAKYYYAFGL